MNIEGLGWSRDGLVQQSKGRLPKSEFPPGVHGYGFSSGKREIGVVILQDLSDNRGQADGYGGLLQMKESRSRHVEGARSTRREEEVR